ncbi:MAG: glycoside hydrolase, partial [Labilithrix sp.]|nr:glycoside hydrolase [Labilithrix sp.]
MMCSTRAIAVAIAFACACAPAACAPARREEASIETASAHVGGGTRTEVPVRSRFQVVFDVPDHSRAPDDVRIEGRFTAPSGAVITTGGFASHGRWMVRFTPREVGAFRYVIRAEGGTGPREVARGELVSTPSRSPGFVTI